MNLYNFTVRLDRSPGDNDVDTMFEAGLDDCLPVSSPDGRGELMVSRRADSLTQAILGVVADLSKAAFKATGIESEDLVNLSVIARRTGRTRASLSLLAQGKRGPGGFPAPAAGGSRPLYSWAAVREWFRAHYGDDAVGGGDQDADTLAAADLLLRARLLTDVTGLAPLVEA
ncbi:MAG: hypothetical protein LBK42_12240 [Propionibacteriaceae bacterium]|jgi:hypothetical protein|nr:hypothetical protein [Propionibacteriaceae bacterium]